MGNTQKEQFDFLPVTLRSRVDRIIPGLHPTDAVIPYDSLGEQPYFGAKIEGVVDHDLVIVEFTSAKIRVITKNPASESDLDLAFEIDKLHKKYNTKLRREL